MGEKVSRCEQLFVSYDEVSREIVCFDLHGVSEGILDYETHFNLL